MSNAGRPSDYSIELARLICDYIAKGESIQDIVNIEGMPKSTTIYEWLAKHKEFAEIYARAREIQADLMDKLILEVANQDPAYVTIESESEEGVKKQKISVDGAEVQHRRLKIDALKWRACHLAPKKYGTQRQEIEHSGTLSLEQAIAKAAEADDRA